MSDIIRLQGYYFPSHEGLLFHSNSFYFSGKKVPYICNNGSKAILLPLGKKLGVKKLRKQAVKCEIEINSWVSPF